MSIDYASIQGKRVLVTGATGFIGSHLTHRLVRDGAEVHVLRRNHSNLTRLQGCLDKLRFWSVDITNRNRLDKIVCEIQPQKVFHCAAYLGKPDDDLNQSVSVNLLGTLNLLRAIQKTGCETFIYMGTCYEYGDTKVPACEHQLIHPLNFYATSKSAAWLFSQMYYKKYDLPVVTVRLFPVYGPFEDALRLIPNVILKSLRRERLLLTLCEQEWDYSYVDDHISGILKAATVDRAIGMTINLGTGRVYSLREIVLLCVSMMGNRVEPEFGALPYRDHEIWYLCADTHIAQSVLNWVPQTILEEGLKRTITWYSENLG